MASEVSPDVERRAVRLERAQAVSLALPAALLAWPGPGAPLADDLQPALTGTGWAVLATLPCAFLLIVRGALPRVAGLVLLLGFVAAGLISLRILPPTDTLEAWRATTLGLVALATFLGGASLGGEGRKWLASGAVAVSLLLTLPALLDGSNANAGALGNSGSTSEAALIGAACGAWLVAGGRGFLRGAGVVALSSYSLYVGVAPVIAGAVSLGVALLATLALARDRRVHAVLLVACTLAGLGGHLLAGLPGTGTPPPPAEDSTLPEASDLTGIEVRASIWRASLDMLRAYPLIGTGPGQFAAAFPPFRDPREIEASSLRRNLAAETEVEHAHNDWLQGALDAGAIGGLLWVALLVLVLARSSGALREGKLGRAGLAAGALAIAVNGIFRAPLLWNPASSTLAFAAFGVVLAKPGRPAWSAVTRALCAAVFVLLALSVPRALRVVEHGRGLASVFRQEPPDLEGLQRALAACGDSTLARSLHARVESIGARQADPRDLVDLEGWQAVLELRPHRFEALMQVGNSYARAERFDPARSHYLRALTLDPEHPGLLRNLVRLEGQAGDVEAALEHVAHWRAVGDLPRSVLETLVVDLMRGMHLDAARRALGELDAAYADLQTQDLYLLSQELEESSPELGRALEGLAHVSWGRQHALQENWAAAVRSYRQARYALGVQLEGPAGRWNHPRLQLEFAAALWRAGQEDAARDEMHDLELAPGDLGRTPAWTADVLRRAGLLGR